MNPVKLIEIEIVIFAVKLNLAVLIGHEFNFFNFIAFVILAKVNALVIGKDLEFDARKLLAPVISVYFDDFEGSNRASSFIRIPVVLHVLFSIVLI